MDLPDAKEDEEREEKKIIPKETKRYPLFEPGFGITRAIEDRFPEIKQTRRGVSGSANEWAIPVTEKRREELDVIYNIAVNINGTGIKHKPLRRNLTNQNTLIQGSFKEVLVGLFHQQDRKNVIQAVEITEKITGVDNLKLFLLEPSNQQSILVAISNIALINNESTTYWIRRVNIATDQLNQYRTTVGTWMSTRGAAVGLFSQQISVP